MTMNSLKQDLQRAALEFGYPTLGVGDVRRIARRRNNARRVSAGLVALAVAVGSGSLLYQAFDRSEGARTGSGTASSSSIEPLPTLPSVNPFGTGAWVVQEVHGIADPPSGRPYVVYLADRTLVGKIDCTEFAAPYEVRGSTLLVDDLVADRNGCSPAELDYLRLLSGLESFELDGRLFLRSTFGTLSLVQAQAESTGPE